VVSTIHAGQCSIVDFKTQLLCGRCRAAANAIGIGTEQKNGMLIKSIRRMIFAALGCRFALSWRALGDSSHHEKAGKTAAR